MTKRTDSFFQSPAISFSNSTSEFDLVFNNGSGTWDNNNGQNWILKVAPPSSGGGNGCTTVPVTFSIANANTTLGQNLYVAGNQTALGNWTPASAFPLTIQGSGANATWSGTLQLPPSDAIQYKYIKYNPSTGAVTWENNQNTNSGNRQATTAACGGSSTFNDGTF
jgi:alpha-amylase